MNNYKIYIHRNKTNNKAYIGQTHYELQERWRKGRGYKSCTSFNRAIEKYGWDNFEHIIWATGLTQEEANRMETLLIAIFDTTNKEKGYNLCYGGANGKRSKETRERMSKAQLNNATSKKVLCIELDTIYPSLSEAGRVYGCSPQAIRHAVVKGTRSKGYHWRYVE